MPIRRASRTAVLVAQGRAVAHGRLVPDRFADPTAMSLLRPAEQKQAEDVRDAAQPADFGSRLSLELIRLTAEAMVPRTLAIDDAVAAHPTPQLVILGAGLDGRAWRLPGLADVAVYEIDQPASQVDKRDRAASLPAGRAPHFVPVDFAHDDLTAVLPAAGHRPDLPTTWIWEGVVPYLTRSQVRATVAAVATLSAPGSRLIVNYQSRSARAAAGRQFAKLLTTLSRRDHPWSSEPWRSTWTPAEMSRLLAAHGFHVRRDDDLFTLAAALGAPASRPTSLRNGRVLIADR